MMLLMVDAFILAVGLFVVVRVVIHLLKRQAHPPGIFVLYWSQLFLLLVGVEMLSGELIYEHPWWLGKRESPTCWFCSEWINDNLRTSIPGYDRLPFFDRVRVRFEVIKATEDADALWDALVGGAMCFIAGLCLWVFVMWGGDP